MGLTRLSITRPLTILMLILGVVLMGAVAYTRLNVDRLPPIEIPSISVTVAYPGASPEDVEALVVEPVEDALAGVPGAERVRSTAREGSGRVFVQLVEGTSVDRAFVEVQRRMGSIGPRLPRDAGEPRIAKFDPNASPIMNLALTGADQEQLLRLGEEVVLPKLLSVTGVADVDLSGGRRKEIQVVLDPGRMAGHGVSADQVTAALERENVTSPAGSLEQQRRSMAVRSLALFQTIEEIENLPLATTRSGAPIHLRNVATVRESYRDQTRLLRFNAEDAVGLSIYKQSDANTIEVARRVRAALEPLQVALPPGSAVVIVNDNSRFVRRSIDAIQFDLGLAAFLTASVLLLFLHTWRNMVIVLLAIPTSLIATMLVMFALGFSLNLMTLMALAMTIGILVDDSIVVLENIHRHLALGKLPFQAAIEGRSEIGLAAIAITFTDIIVYLPVAFMQGNVGQLFRQYGITIAAATFFSLLISFTLTPMLASRWLGRPAPRRGRPGLGARFTARWEGGMDSLAGRYSSLLGWSLRHRPVVLAVGMLALVAGLAAVPLNLLGTEYAPQEDDGQFRVNLTMPVGSSLDVVDRAARQLEQRLLDLADVRSVYVSVGGGGGGAGASFTVEVTEKGHRSRSLDDLLAEVRTIGREVPEARVRTSVQNPLSGGRVGIAIDVLGADLASLNEIAGRIIEIAEATPGIAEASSTAEQRAPEMRFVVNRERAANLGVSASQVGSALRTMVQGRLVSALRPEGGVAQDIRVMGPQDGSLTPQTLAGLPVAIRSSGPVYLGQVSTQRRSQTPVQIQRVDRKRTVQVSATVAGRSIGDVARDLRANLAGQLALPPGYRWEVRGTVQALEAAFAALTGALALSVLLVYMLLVALYESWLYPLAIMFALPVSLVGAFGGLLITGNTLNIFSMIGMIALMGLVAKNGILLVDYTNTLRVQGVERTDALRQAARTRLRPILMTSGTVVAAMLPLAFKFEAGAESRAPMAVVIIGGVISSTLLTLVLVPVMYAYLDDLQALAGLQHRFRWPWRRQSLAPAPAAASPGGGAGVARPGVMASSGESDTQR